MRIMTVLVALASLMMPGVASAGEVNLRTITLRPMEAGTLPPALADLVPGLIEASLESGEGYEVGPLTSTTGWALAVKVSGRGPWALSAKATARTEEVSRGRISIRKIPFSDREGLIRAVDTLAANLHAGWKADFTTGQPEAGEPVPLARFLSSSAVAVEAYVRGISALRSDAASETAGLLDEALAADPSFAMAAAQRARLALAAGQDDDALELLERANPRSGTPRQGLAADLVETLRLIARADAAGALRRADALMARAPHLVWGRVLRAAALGLMVERGKESVDEWQLVMTADPDDVAHRAWQGRSMMAAGDFKSAATTLGAARAAWPSNLILYTLQAESLARLRETEAARGVVTAMKEYMLLHDLTAPSDALNPFLLLGSIDLLQGRFAAGLAGFEEAIEMKSKSGGRFAPSTKLHQTIVEMRRDLVTSYDELRRNRQLDDTVQSLREFEESLSADERQQRAAELLRLEGLITLKRGDTVAAWKTVEEIRALAGRPGYTAYDEAYLSAATSMKEGDLAGAVSHFERAAAARGVLVDQMDLGQALLGQGRFDEARASLVAIEKGLEVYLPSSEHDDLILADPHLAAMMPTYQYVRARLAYETGLGDESRKYFNRMLKYLRNPDEPFAGMVKEAVDRGARPE